jgi:hypothetical protein
MTPFEFFMLHIPMINTACNKYTQCHAQIGTDRLSLGCQTICVLLLLT